MMWPRNMMILSFSVHFMKWIIQRQLFQANTVATLGALRQNSLLRGREVMKLEVMLAINSMPKYGGKLFCALLHGLWYLYQAVRKIALISISIISKVLTTISLHSSNSGRDHIENLQIHQTWSVATTVACKLHIQRSNMVDTKMLNIMACTLRGMLLWLTGTRC